MFRKRFARPFSVLAAGTLAASLGAASAPASAGAAVSAGTSASIAASAIRPGHWARVTTPWVDALDPEVGLVRGSDGVLHVLWQKGTAPSRIMDTPIRASGTVGSPVTVASGIQLAQDPDGTATPSGLDAFFYGLISGRAEGTYEATRPRSGGSWKLSPAVVTPPIGVAEGAAQAAATGPDGTPWLASGGGVLLVDHVGHPEVRVGSGFKCCLDEAGIGVNGKTGQAWVTYMSIISGHEGIFARPLTVAGTSGGPARLLPGSRHRGLVVPIDQRVATTSRGRGRSGVYVLYGSGYPDFRALKLIKLGSATARTMATFSAGGPSVAGSAITADANGRLWVAWFDGDGSRPALFVRRSNQAATKFGPVRRVPLLAGTTRLVRVYISASAGRLDVVALTSRHHNDSKAAYFATEVLPPR